MVKQFFIYIPIRDDWGILHNHRIRGYTTLKKAKKALNKFDSGHISNNKDFFVVIKQRGHIIYEKD